MPRLRLIIVCLVCAFTAAALPAAGVAQTSRQAQYGGVPGPTVPSSSAPQAPAQSSSKTLPLTGQDLMLLALAAAALIGLGLALRGAAGSARRTGGA